MPRPSQTGKGGATEPAEMSQPGPEQCRITRALLAESLQNNVRRHNRFLADQGFEKPYLTPDIVKAYLAQTQSLAPGTRYTRLSVLRQFSRYLHQLEPESHLLGQLPVKRPNLLHYYLYDDELQTLMHATRNLSPASSLRSHTYYTLIGLLYTTGLRIDEALSLDLRDVRLEEKLLDVRLGEFAKARLLPLADSTVDALHAYEDLRRACHSTRASEPFFISRWGRRLKYRTVARTFKKLIARGGIGARADPPPRLHHLRHTFATRCLLKWYREGKDVNAMLPTLATYMGHASIEHTLVYLHLSSQVLAEAKTQFQQAFPLQIQV